MWPARRQDAMIGFQTFQPRKLEEGTGDVCGVVQSVAPYTVCSRSG